MGTPVPRNHWLFWRDWQLQYWRDTALQSLNSVLNQTHLPVHFKCSWRLWLDFSGVFNLNSAEHWCFDGGWGCSLTCWSKISHSCLTGDYCKCHSLFTSFPYSSNCSVIPHALWMRSLFTPIRTEMYHHRIKMITQNSFALICSVPGTSGPKPCQQNARHSIAEPPHFQRVTFILPVCIFQYFFIFLNFTRSKTSIHLFIFITWPL